jgi:transposase
MTCPQVATLLGDAPRTVEYWIQRVEERGFAGLAEGERSGRPRRLSEAQLAEIEKVLRKTPTEAGLKGVGPWDGRSLSQFLQDRFGVQLKVRQCQRLFRQLGFRLRKPRPVIAHADAEQQRAVKKTPRTGRRSRR